jgi:hypothetical protein
VGAGHGATRDTKHAHEPRCVRGTWSGAGHGAGVGQRAVRAPREAGAVGTGIRTLASFGHPGARMTLSIFVWLSLVSPQLLKCIFN